jgi:dihydroorotate dehydrogenase
MYRLARPLLFRSDPEKIHDQTLDALAWCSRHPGALRLLEWFFAVSDPRLNVKAFGLDFANPLALAAGMDKNARAIPAWAALGFGAVELGTITAEAQEGNVRPRLFRLEADDALINRMGFNNEGADSVAARLAALGEARPEVLRVGLNVGKSRSAPLEAATQDYARSLARLWPHADYLVLNVSSPNTPGLRQLQAREPLEELLAFVQSLARRDPRPVLLKIAPDLSDAALADICELAGQYGLAGLIATNTTVSRSGLTRDPAEAGGLSGLPLRRRSLQVLRFLRQHTDLPLISAGGVWNAQDVIDRLRAGAVQVQLFTGYVYGGPGLVTRILRELLLEVEREQLAGVQELIDSDNR